MYTEPGLAGWRVFADLNQDGLWSTGEPFDISEEDGSYNVSLAPGQATIRVEALPGWAPTAPSSTPATHGYDVTVIDGQEIAEQHFGLALSPQVDLDVDTDNNNGFGTPDRSAAEDADEADATLPGKLIATNAGDVDGDGVTDWLDGFDGDGVTSADDALTGVQFTPVVLDLGGLSDIDAASIRINYNHSAPSNVANPGHFRLWTKDAAEARTLADFIDPDLTYSAADLGASAGSPVVTLYAEAVAATTSANQRSVRVTIDLDGSGPLSTQLSDTVYLTATGESATAGSLTATLGGPSNLSPGSDATYIVTVTTPDGAFVSDADVVWSVTRNGQPYAPPGSSNSDTLALTGLPAGVYAVQALVTGSTGAEGLAVAGLHVFESSRVYPTLSGPATSVAGETYTLTLDGSEFSQAPAQWQIDWGDGFADTLGGSASTASHVFDTGGGYHVVTAQAQVNGEWLYAEPVVVRVDHAVPNIGLTLSSNALEVGESLTLTLDDVAAVGGRYWLVDWGDGTVQQLPISASSVAHTYWTAVDGEVWVRWVGESVPQDTTAMVTVTDTVSAARADRYAIRADETLHAVLTQQGVLANDATPDAAGASWSVTPLPQSGQSVTTETDGGLTVATESGSVTLYADGTFRYTPGAGFVGTDTFAYEVNDGNGAVDQANVTLNVRPALSNSAPLAANLNITGAYGSPVEIDAFSQGLIRQSVDPDGDLLAIDSSSIITGNGSLIVLANGTWRYTPGAGDESARIAFTITDGAATDIGYIDVTFRNIAPILTPLNFTVIAGDTLNVAVEAGLLVAASDSDANALSIVGIQSGQTQLRYSTQGQEVQLNADGSFTYASDFAFEGEDRFTYTLTDGADQVTGSVIFNVVNPTALALDDAYEVRAGQTLTIIAEEGLLINDLDAGQTLAAINNPAGITALHGMVSVEADGAFSYTPTTDFVGADYFVYVLLDGSGESNQAVVRIEVVSEAPIGIDDSYRVDQADTLTVNSARGLLANDSAYEAGTPLTVSLVDTPEDGNLTLASDGSFEYAAPADYVGEVTFTYVVSDGVETSEPVGVTIFVSSAGAVAVSDIYDVSHGQTLTPILAEGLLANDLGDADLLQVADPGSIQAQHGSLSVLADGTFSYTPNAGFVGTETFEYTITNGAETSYIATVSVLVTNNTPTAANQSFQATQGTDLSALLVASDTDPTDAAALTFTLISNPAYGQIVLSTDGSFVYTPNTDLDVPDRFVFEVTDTLGQSAVGVVRIDVAASNAAPTVSAVNLTLHPDDVLNVNLAAYVDDDDPVGLTFTLASPPSAGTAQIDTDGRATVTPARRGPRRLPWM